MPCRPACFKLRSGPGTNGLVSCQKKGVLRAGPLGLAHLASYRCGPSCMVARTASPFSQRRTAQARAGTRAWSSRSLTPPRRCRAGGDASGGSSAVSWNRLSHPPPKSSAVQLNRPPAEPASSLYKFSGQCFPVHFRQAQPSLALSRFIWS